MSRVELNMTDETRALVLDAKRFTPTDKRIGLRAFLAASSRTCSHLLRQAFRTQSSRPDAESFLPTYAHVNCSRRRQPVTSSLARCLKERAINDVIACAVESAIESVDLAQEDHLAAEATAYGSVIAALRGEYKAAKERVGSALSGSILRSTVVQIHMKRLRGMTEQTVQDLSGGYGLGCYEGRLFLALAANEIVNIGAPLPFSVLSKATFGPLASRASHALLGAARRLTDEGAIASEDARLRLSSSCAEGLYEAISRDPLETWEEASLMEEIHSML